jgi:hypothetical protein
VSRNPAHDPSRRCASAEGQHSHVRSKPFLHFHNGPDRTYADVRFGGDFEPVTASTPKQRQVLLEQVKAHVTAELAARQRKRGQGRKNGRNGGYFVHVS